MSACNAHICLDLISFCGLEALSIASLLLTRWYEPANFKEHLYCCTSRVVLYHVPMSTGACCGTERLRLNTGVAMTALHKHRELSMSRLAGRLGPCRTGFSSDASTPPH